MKIVYLGSGRFGIESLNALEESSHRIELIVTQPPQPAGRGKKTTPTPVSTWAKQHQIKIVETEDVNSPQIIETIAASKPDILVVIAFGQKLDNKLINIAPKKAINVHASLLPKYRGAAPINWAIINGEEQTGISIITLAEKMDAGQIIAQSATDIEPDESAEALHDRLAKMAAPLLLDTLALIETDRAVYKPQDDSKATRAPKLKKSDAFIDFAEPAEIIRRKILGLWPWPGATAYYLAEKTKKSERTIIADARTIQHNNPQNLRPGTLDENLDIICSRNALKIVKIKPAGGKLMNFKDFVNGRGCRPGDIFVKIEK